MTAELHWVRVADATLAPSDVVACDEHDVVVWRTADGIWAEVDR